MAATDRPVDRIVLRDFVLRRLSVNDVEPLVAAITESLDHLRPWMPWAAEQPTIPAQREYADAMTRQWDAGETFSYVILGPAEGEVLGAIGVHSRVGPGGWDIGYWVHARHTGRGIATTSAAVLTGVTLSLPGTERVEIHCDEANVPSAAVPRRLGYRLDRLQEHTRDAPAETGQRLIWTMSRDAYPASAAYRLTAAVAAEG